VFLRIQANDAGVVHHFGKDQHVVLGLHDGVVVVVEVIRQHRRAGVGAEGDEAAVGQRPHLGVIELAVFFGRGVALAQALLAGFRQRRKSSVRRVDDDRAARDAVNADHVVAGIEPEPVVAADGAAGRLGDELDERGLARRRQRLGVAALDRHAAIRVARLIAELLDNARALLEGGGLLGGQRRVLTHPLERRLRLVAPVPLQVRLAVRRTRHTPRLAFADSRCLSGRRLRSERDECDPENADDKDE
jgi:hypothetical protein